ncbi:uncharacterized protein [Diadema setosum]|uniref:uncharacterized protein n=1 Tax=Diadema setosum TaxID=31175 RepID=UPI003B3B5CDC
MAFYHTACFVFTIMIICNAILYPTIFSTIFQQWLGGSPPKPEKEPIPEYPPHMRPGGGARGRMNMGAGPGPGSGKQPMGGARPTVFVFKVRNNITVNMWYGVLRAVVLFFSTGPVDSSSFMAQSQQESSRGRGMMGTVLPVYAVGIFVYFGYVIYKVFLKDKSPSSNNRGSSGGGWGFRDNGYQDGPSLQREQEEKLQRQLAAELRAANYPDWRKGEPRRASSNKVDLSPSKKSSGEGARHYNSFLFFLPPGSEEEVDVLKKRLEETEKTMQRMMDMMNNMGVAMNRVTQHLASNEKDDPAVVLSNLTKPEVNDQDMDANEADVDVDVEDLSDEEDLLIGDGIEVSMDRSSEEENDVEQRDSDIEERRPNKMNIVDVEADYDEQDDEEVDSDDESEVENIGADEDPLPDTLRRRNVKGSDVDDADGTGIEG